MCELCHVRAGHTTPTDVITTALTTGINLHMPQKKIGATQPILHLKTGGLSQQTCTLAQSKLPLPTVPVVMSSLFTPQATTVLT